MLCYCGSKHPYKTCCGPIIEGAQQAPTPEKLMRSRYSAYVQGNTGYIQNSMCGVAAEGFDPASAKQWAQSVTWQELVIKKAYQDKTNPAIGYVEFIAKFCDSTGIAQELAEISEFRKINEQWFYFDGKTSAKSMNSVYTRETLTDTRAQKPGRNDLCPCGSGK